MQRTRLIAGIALGLLISVGARAAEKTIQQEKLPPAVQKTAADQSAGATVTGYTSDKVDGVMVYQMNLLVDGLTRGIVMDREGNVTAVEQEMAWSDVPEDMQKAFSGVASKGTLGPVSSVTTDGQVVAYEAYLTVKGERSLVRVKPKAAEALAPIPGSNR